MSDNQPTKEKIATCHTCHWPIYKGKLIHYSSTGSHSGDIVGSSSGRRGDSIHWGSYSGTSHTDQWVQCNWCLNEWRKEKVKFKVLKWKCLWKTFWITLILFLLGIFLYCITKDRDGLVMFLAYGLGYGLFVIPIISLIFAWFASLFIPKPNRYRFRYRKS